MSLQGDQILLDVSDVIAQVQQRLVARGLTILQRVPIPQVDKQLFGSTEKPHRSAS